MAEEERIGGEKERMLAEDDYSSASHRRHSYLASGVYVDQIREWHQPFDPGQLLVIKSEDFFKDPQKFLGEASNFLGLLAWQPEVLSASLRNESDYDPMSPAVRKKLESYFKPHNKKLYDYLGTVFGW